MKKELLHPEVSRTIDTKETNSFGTFQSDSFNETIFSFDWLLQRIRTLVESTDAELDPVTFDESSCFGKLVRDFDLNESEIALVMVALASSIEPILFEALKVEASKGKSGITGGSTNRVTDLFTPTIRTVVFLLSGDYTDRKVQAIKELHSKSKPFALGLVKTIPTTKDCPFLDNQIAFNDQFLDTVLFGESPRLDGDPGFPVRKSFSVHSLNDLIVKEKTMTSLLKLHRFARNMEKLWDLEGSGKVRRNYLCVFSGDSGTGKSFAAEYIASRRNFIRIAQTD